MRCTQILGFDSAHRIIGHSGNCKMLHGHRYTLEATFESDKLDDLGMVIDFSIIKQKLTKWLNTKISYKLDKKYSLAFDYSYRFAKNIRPHTIKFSIIKNL